MPGLEIAGLIAGKPRTESTDEVTQGTESYGMFVVGDVRTIAEYSGSELGSRWLCRAQGPLVDRVKSWPTPSSETWRYHPTEEAARTMYMQLRAHAIASSPGLQLVDTRQNLPLNVPSALSESGYEGQNEVLRLVMDRMSDLQVAVRQTNCIRKFSAHPARPDGPELVSYFTGNDVCRLALAKGPSGAAEHLAIVFALEADPEPTIREGLPGAYEKINHTTKPFRFPSNLAVAFWGRTPGSSLLAPARGQDPAAALSGYLGHRLAAPLQTNFADVDARLGGVPAAWVVRMEPGEYVARYYELNASADGGYSCLAISRVGAQAFQPATLSRAAAGRVIGGMTLEQYAAMAVERDAILMQQGADAGQALAQLCARYGREVPMAPFGGINIGYAGRIPEWDLAIQADAALSAEWITQMTAARMRASGQVLTQEQITAMSLQQYEVARQVQDNAKRHEEGKQRINTAAIAVLEAASRGAAKEQLVAQARQAAPQNASDVLYEAVRILKNPGEKSSPKMNGVGQFAERVCQAHWATMSPEDQKFEGGKEASYVKDQIADIFEKNGLPVPGVGGFLSRFVDKL